MTVIVRLALGFPAGMVMGQRWTLELDHFKQNFDFGQHDYTFAYIRL